MAAGLGIDRNLVLDYGRAGEWRLNFKNQTYPSNPGVNPGLITPKTKKFPLDPQFKPTVHCSHMSNADLMNVFLYPWNMSQLSTSKLNYLFSLSPYMTKHALNIMKLLDLIRP